MGCLQCLESNELYLGDLSVSKHYQFNIEDIQPEERPIKYDDEENAATRQTQQQKKSNFNLYKNKRDELLFEDFSYMSRSLEQSNTIDYYQLSRCIFEALNSIRVKPETYYSLLFESTDTYDQKYKDIKQKIDQCRNSDEVSLIKKHLEGNRRGEFVLWNEKVYLAISSYLREVEECKNSQDSNNSKLLLAKTASQRVSEKLQGKYTCIEFNINGFYHSDICLWNLIYENTARLKQLLLDKYSSGAICCYPIKGEHQMRTILYLVNKINLIISGVNTETGENEKYELNNPIFNDIPYKEQIVNGIFLSDGSVMTITFSLSTGETKEETIKLI